MMRIVAVIALAGLLVGLPAVRTTGDLNRHKSLKFK